MHKSLSLALGIVLSATLNHAAIAEMAPVTLNSGWVLNGGSSPLLLADERGYFEEGGADVDVQRGFGSSDVVAKVAAGTYQAGTGSLPALVRAIAENPDLDAIAVMISYDASPDAIVGPLSTGIKEPLDLAGRTISTQPNSTTQAIFPPFAEATGVAPDSVKWLEVGPELLGVTVSNGESDGIGQFAASAISNFARMGVPKEELYEFKFSDYVENLYGNGLILQKSWAEANPEAAKAVVRGYALGLIDSYKDPTAAIDVLMEREPLLTREVEEADLAYSIENYYFTPNVLENGLAYHSEEDVQGFIDLLAAAFEMPRVPTASEVFSSAYLPSAKELAINE
ncbi:ABC transporter substrate-binding protein [Hoeflea sp. CAU 1731]